MRINKIATRLAEAPGESAWLSKLATRADCRKEGANAEPNRERESDEKARTQEQNTSSSRTREGEGAGDAGGKAVMAKIKRALVRLSGDDHQLHDHTGLGTPITSRNQ